MRAVVRGVLCGALAVVALAGCGIRATPVPVDAGPAPSRVACGPLEPDDGTGAERERVRVSLVCSGRVVDVRRVVELPGAADRLGLARALLDELRRTPDEGELAAGFTTAVPGDLRLDGPAPDDGAGTLRLSRPPSALPSFALAQLVCTFADTPLADASGRIALGGPPDAAARDGADGTDGPDGTDGGTGGEVRGYACGGELRTAAEDAETAGVPL
ncbi:hypothetical protein V1J52_06795 [Streptomyces sp. TRM 70351]|uniref:hypothetical protein n=1 Tax=Streptomyces sp. TRM 70351 TaxID=3116552 RepID=UPI002E7AF834|nr:hypothetical protein [Streptomyces sp. TRM 70351]MEE1927902.1 hypothetical protein [Streptomyces sp. TRM 70351]